ncbi:MAG: ABC transporter permease [Candidatus Omnitrophota bacterium]|nr:ABC transporter permease [Candidatus Omnitrophota bacterium]
MNNQVFTKAKNFFTAAFRMIFESILALGNALFFTAEVFSNIFRGKIRFKELIKQIYEQGTQSVGIIALTSAATGMVLALQGYTILVRFGAKEYVANLVVLSLVRELSPVLSSIVFSGKAGARISAELGSMKVNDQVLATRTLGVDPVEYFIVPRVMACLIVLPLLVVISEVIGVLGGYLIGTVDAKMAGVFYWQHTITSIAFVDFFSGIIKTIFFSLLIGLVCCYQGFQTKGGSLGVGQYTTRAVALCYILVIISNFVLTKLILAFWG